MGVTLDKVIDRLYRDYLYPPDEQPVQTTLATTITISGTTVVLTDNILTQEEEDSIGVGTIFEIGQELFRVTALAVWPTCTVATRGTVGGTAAAIHTAGDRVIIRPKYPRAGVYEAVCDAIEYLNGELFSTVTSDTFTTTESLIEVPATVQAILGFMYRAYDSASSTTRYVPGAVELITGMPTTVSTTGKAIQIHTGAITRTGYYIYKSGFARPTDETYDLTDDAPNFETKWVPLVLLGALIDLLAGADLGARTVEYITDALESEGFPPGTGEAIDRALVRIYEYRLGKAVKLLNRTNPMRVEQNQVVYG